MTDPEELRYREYLQKELLLPGAEALFDDGLRREWLSHNLDRLKSHLPGIGDAERDQMLRDYAQLAVDFKPETRFESFSAHGIFGPMLDQLIRTLGEAGFRLQHPVKLATSTSLSITPFARPAEGSHCLFIGLGTFSFCNYWSKAFALLFTTLGEILRWKAPIRRKDVVVALQTHPLLSFLSARLAAYYASYGTLVQFGEVPIASIAYAYRAELLRAMEWFVVGHEIGHFLAEERQPEYRGLLDQHRSIKLEKQCDSIGLFASRELGVRESNWCAFAGAGAALFFWATMICEDARRLVVGAQESGETTHPNTLERLRATREWVWTRTDRDQRRHTLQYFDEIDGIAAALHAHVLGVIETAVKH